MARYIPISSSATHQRQHRRHHAPSKRSAPSSLSAAIKILITATTTSILLLLTLSSSSNTHTIQALTLPSYGSYIHSGWLSRKQQGLNTRYRKATRLHVGASESSTFDDETLWKIRDDDGTATIPVYGPVPRGGTLSDLTVLPPTTTTLALRGGNGFNNGNGGATVSIMEVPRIPGTRAVRGVRNFVMGTAMNVHGVFSRGGGGNNQHHRHHEKSSRQVVVNNRRHNSVVNNNNASSSMVKLQQLRPNQQQQQQQQQRIVINTNIYGPSTMLHGVGRSINLHRRRRRAARDARIANNSSISNNNASSSSINVVAARYDKAALSKSRNNKANSSKSKKRRGMRMETIDTIDVLGDMEGWSDMEMAMNELSSFDAASSLSSSSSSSSTSTAIAKASLIETVDKSDPLSLIPIVGRLFQRREEVVGSAQQQLRGEVGTHTAKYDSSTVTVSNEALSSRGGSASTAVAESSSEPSTALYSFDMMDTYVIETPLFPIILPKAFEPRTAAAAATAVSTSSSTAASVTSLEISVAIEAQGADGVTIAKPSAQLLQAVTQPLLPKQLMSSFTGRELYYPETIEALAQTGLKMIIGPTNNEYITWVGEKKTDKFLKDQGAVNGATASVMSSPEWYQALDSSQEVLVWVGKSKISSKDDAYGAELPIIKSTSIIHQSPKYLAELLMDSSRVQVYNKMSLGRTDVKVFQTGVDTQDGPFGDGESKIVRNLTKPPMVSSLIEFITAMHARRLRPDDMKIQSPDDQNIDHAAAAEGGYIVVSRAMTGGEWNTDNSSPKISSSGEKLVRNEILMGINILKPVPGEPNKTELTSVTHVYSPMIPVMLAKSAGVKGAIDFVKDIRALP